LREIPQLGERGGGWVVLQFALIAVVIVVGVTGPRWPESVSAGLSVASGLAALVGAALALLSARALGPSLTPYPRPRGPASFVERGPYRIVRHPIYLGGILFLGGFSLAFSPWALLATGALVLVWGMKSAVEERFLRARFPEYASYCERTRFRLVPFVY
jgi:protein-S-isoprenylcysteine O-methyltransferase Ste14